MTEVKVYEVGGCVRDRVLGVECNDVDYAVVAPSFEAMVDHVENYLRGTVFLSNPEFVTLRARVPGMTKGADFVLCRKESQYTDGRHPDVVEVGTLETDLARRDLCVNAIARDPVTGKFVDPFDGLKDCKYGLLRAVGNAKDRFEEDPLRLLRCFRFLVTLRTERNTKFQLMDDLDEMLKSHHCVHKMMETVSMDRVREELNKAFRYDTYGTLRLLDEYTELRSALFDNPALSLEVKQGRY